MQPDYSRQMTLKDIGVSGQAALARSRVLIVGIGGLGSPVVQYLAGAGVGYLGLVDADALEASNLHRQPLYALQDAGMGTPKVDLARAALLAINPSVTVETYAVRFAAGNALDLVRAYDVVVDCTDNFRAKFLINDAAVLARRSAVFASVYQYEGQLQVYRPHAAHACLRCLWPQPSADGLVGNCAEAGVLGPIPGAFGSLQALLTLKILLSLPGQLEGELLLYDFMNFSTHKLRVPRRARCVAPACALIRQITADADEDPSAVDDMEVASLEGLGPQVEVIDIRTPAEVAAAPAGARHIAMPMLLADPQLLSPQGDYVLVCASGRRSLAAARQLRKSGLTVRSLAGGLRLASHG